MNSFPRPSQSNASTWRALRARALALLTGEGSVHRALLDRIGRSSANYVLVLGCGSTALVDALERRFRRAGVFAIDEDIPAFHRAIREAKRTGSRVNYDWSKLTSLPFPSDGIDVLVGRYLLARYPPDVALDVLKEACRVVRPGGEIYLVEPAAVRTWWNQNPKEGQQQYLGEYLLRKAGFKAYATAERIPTLRGPMTLFEAIKPL